MKFKEGDVANALIGSLSGPIICMGKCKCLPTCSYIWVLPIQYILESKEIKQQHYIRVHPDLDLRPIK